MNEEMKFGIYEICKTRRDLSKAEKIIYGIEGGYVNKDNYWDYVKNYTKNAKGDHSLNRWQVISEYIYKKMYGVRHK